MNVLDKFKQAEHQINVLWGATEQCATPDFIVKEMMSEVPESLLKDKSTVIFDSSCGRGPFLLEGAKQKWMLQRKNDNDVECLENIIDTQIKGIDYSPDFHLMAQSTFTRLVEHSVNNIDCEDFLLYNKNTMTDNTKLISITNPPYQPPRGVKKGGNEYKKHVEKSIKSCPKFGVANIPMTFMVQDPFDRDNNKFKQLLLNAGLKKIKHIRPDAYTANVLTVYIVWEQGYTGPVEFLTYDVADVNLYHSVSIAKDKLRDMSIWPVARTAAEVDLAVDIMTYAKKRYKFISNKPELKGQWCVEYEYLIGMEKERMNKDAPIRGIAKRGPTDTVRGAGLSKFINVDNEALADSLVNHLSTVGQQWFKMIPRGSSAENWMIGPVIEMWWEKNIPDELFEKAA